MSNYINISGQTMLMSSSYNNNFYLCVKNYSIIHFNNEQPLFEQAIYNSFLVFDENLNHLNLTYNKYSTENTGEQQTYLDATNMNIVFDDNNNMYIFSSNNSSQSIPGKITFKDNSTLNIINGEKNGCLFKYNSNYQLISAITYHRNPDDSVYTEINLNSAICINNDIFVLLSSEKDYFRTIMGNNTIKILEDDIIANNYIIVKYFDDLTTVLWYKKFYSLTSPIMNDVSTNKHIIKDTKGKYLYISNTVSCTDLYCVDNMNNIINIFNNDVFSEKFLIHKINALNGEIFFTKKIYILNNISISDYSLNNSNIIKMIYCDDCIYLLCKTKGYLKIDDIIYGTENNNDKTYLIKMSDLGVVYWVSQLSDDNNCIMTDMISYNGKFGKNIYLTGYFTNYTKIKSYDIKSAGIGSFIIKLNIFDGSVKNIKTKNSTKTIKIKSIVVKIDSLFISGDFIGSIYIGGKNKNNIKYCEHNEIFLEEIKINTF